MSEATAIDGVIGSRLSNLRLHRGIDIDDFAKSIGLSKADVSDYENGIKRIDARVLLDICKTLRVNLSYFFKPWIDLRGGSAVTECFDLAAE